MRIRLLVFFIFCFLSISLAGYCVLRPGPEQIAARMTDEQVLDLLRQVRFADCTWYGTNHWKLMENGWDGGGHGNYEFISNTNNKYYHLFSQLFWGSPTNRLAKNPRILFPLLESDSFEDILAAFYCYKHSGLPARNSGRDNYGSKSDLEMTGDIFRKLLNNNRDVRVRFLAAEYLRAAELFELEDIERMLSDENFSVQCEGVLTAHNAIRMIGSAKKIERNSGQGKIGFAKNIQEGKVYDEKKLLGEIVLKHLNDNHFYIRSSSYSIFRKLIKRMVPAKREGNYTQELAKLPEHMNRHWERESWWKRRQEQQKLIAWWEKNSDHVVRNYGHDWEIEK